MISAPRESPSHANCSYSDQTSKYHGPEGNESLHRSETARILSPEPIKPKEIRNKPQVWIWDSGESRQIPRCEPGEFARYSPRPNVSGSNQYALAISIAPAATRRLGPILLRY